MRANTTVVQRHLATAAIEPSIKGHTMIEYVFHLRYKWHFKYIPTFSLSLSNIRQLMVSLDAKKK